LPVRARANASAHGSFTVAPTALSAPQPRTARDLYAELVPDFERVLGREHPDTLYATANLALATGRTGDAAGRDLYAGLVPDFERVLGREHPDTLAVRSSFAFWTGRAGDAAAAPDRYADLVPDRQAGFTPGRGVEDSV
jgi:hypothetical protein